MPYLKQSISNVIFIKVLHIKEITTCYVMSYVFYLNSYYLYLVNQVLVA